MSGGIRTHCAKCFHKLNKVNTCPKCGWNYEKEFGGQKELDKKKDGK